VPNTLERQLIRLDKGETPTIQERNFYGFYPRVAWIARGSGISFGTRYWKQDIAGPLDLAGAAFYSIHGYQHYDIQFGLIPNRGQLPPAPAWRGEELYQMGNPRPSGLPRFNLYGTFRHRYLPQQDFFGLGPDSSGETRTNYLLESTALYLRTGVEFSGHVAWNVTGGYYAFSLGPGKDGGLPTTQEAFGDTGLPGLPTAPDYLRLGSTLLLEFRDEPLNPHKGFVLAVGAVRWGDQTEDAFNFNSFLMDARGFIPLGSRQRVLALRSAIVIDDPDSGNEVPFFLQPSLGGSHTLRGFDSFRFQGPKAMLYQLEYRWEPLPLWELAIFTDTGTVSEPGEDLKFSDLKWDYGVGLRIKNFQGVLVRIDIAWSNETTRFFFRTSASF
jgi:hypothetical protein